MNRNPFIAFLLSGAILCIIFFTWVFITFSFGETFDQYRTNALALFIIIFLFLVVVIYRIRERLKAGEKALAVGASILPVIAFIAALMHYIHYLDHHIPFNQETWNRSVPKPLNMTVSLVKGQTLIGLNALQVKERLGQTIENEGEGPDRHAVSYFIEDNWILLIYFENDRVVKTELRQPWLCV